MADLPPPNAGPPVRLQLARTAGFKLQVASRQLNGLPAVNVARPGPFGNYAAKRMGVLKGPLAVQLFREWVEGEANPLWVKSAAAQLRGKNLACWCKPGAPCHGDVLLELANRPACEAIPS